MTEDEATLSIRQAKYDRAGELTRCVNMRMHKKSWGKSEWSPYQRHVASAILRVVLPAVDRTEARTTEHGSWVSELQAVTAAINEVMAEMPDNEAKTAPTVQGDREPVRH